ncbi:VOC family protein [Serinicoccus kebangsaanensis]|uniref:VOC family protein n=1 Tax=Serinicoccus kebangsaanensis TaxID=2602069 RepID=UPI00124E6ECC|nr:VOC family protein [Serinicoccus kebangsaanensis]
MDITRDIYSVTVVVEDLDRALAFYRDVLGCEVRMDAEPFPGSRLVEVAPPGSAVGIALLTRDSGLPLGVRYWTDDAERAHQALREAGVEPHQEVLRLDGMPPMFTLDDSEGNTVILLERPRPESSAGDGS